MDRKLDNSAPQISVLLPVYNGAQFLNTTINCLLVQSYTNFEIIACDDCSTDNSWSLLKEWTKRDSRLRLIRNSHNLGVFKTQQRLANEARGEFFAQQDQDDYSAPDRLATQLQILVKNPDAVATVANVWLVDEEGNPIGITKLPQTPEALAAAMRHDNVCIHSTLMLRRQVFEKIGGYSIEADHVADYDLMLRLLREGPIIPCQSPLATYGLSPGTVTYRDRKTQRALAKEIRHKYFGTPKPDRIHFPPLQPEEARQKYHFEVGKLYLFKGNNKKARYNLHRAFTRKPDLVTGLYYLMSLPPAMAAVKLARFVKHGFPKNSTQDYFLFNQQNKR